jgi:hypothetical protein
MKRQQTDQLKQPHHSSISTMNMDEVVDRVRAMRNQEETTYLYRLFLPSHLNNGGKSTDIRSMNVVWREKICQWSYNVVDQ